jgi:ankyrin repeat protein
MSVTGLALLPGVILFAVVVIACGVAFVIWLIRGGEGGRRSGQGSDGHADDDARVMPSAVAHRRAPAVSPGNLAMRPIVRDVQFAYATGDRPLDGYTIKRGIGRGGFGEVYYAISDGGKEVALKLVQRHLDVELRGVTQCLNLKHANLVTIYDVKQSGNGDYWIVMEYLSGAGLSDVLAANPAGLPNDQVIAWLRGIADGVGYLHEHGIVHRDLKPGNIFVENGIVKIGDYGLAKFISASRRSGQTESVGTVHYMAPEIAHGRYGKEIDLYAIGVILYELLTGRVPFNGQSPGEIMMKHLTAQPDTSVLPEPYRAVVARLLAKDPAERYTTVNEVVAELAGESSPVAARIKPAAVPPTVAYQQPASWAAQPPRARRGGSRRTGFRIISPTVVAVGIVAIVVGGLYLARMAPMAASQRQGVSSVSAISTRGPGADDVDMVLKTYLNIEAYEKPLTEIAGRAGMTTFDQVYLIDAVVRSVPIVEEKARILEQLASNPDLTGPARRHLIQRLDSIPVVGERERITERLLANSGRPNSSFGDTHSEFTAGGFRAFVVFYSCVAAGVALLVLVVFRRAGRRLFRAAKAGDISRVRLLLADGADVNARRWNNRTALIAAAEAGHIAVVEHLLERGADPNARLTDGESALSLATVAGHTTVVEVLLAAGADVNSRASDGDTPLIEAAYAGHVGILKKMLEHGGDMTARSGGDGSTPLIWAAYGGHTECVVALLQHGANVNEKDTGDGSTPLIWAAWGNHPNVVSVLLDHGADARETNSSGETALDHAESEAIREMLEAAATKR